MSTSLLYHGFGIHGYRYVRTLFESGTIIFRIALYALTQRCPKCKSQTLKRRDTCCAYIQAIPIGSVPGFFELSIQRVECMRCKIVRQVKLGFADRCRSCTRSFEGCVLALCRHMTIQDLARHLKHEWDTVKDIFKRYLKRRFERPKISHLKKIALDEISIGIRASLLDRCFRPGFRCCCICGDGKGSDALFPFWKRLKGSNADINAVA